MCSFNKPVGMFLCKFSTVQLNVKMKVFQSLRVSFHGIVLLYETKGCAATMKRLAVSYHYDLKRLICFPKFISILHKYKKL